MKWNIYIPGFRSHLLLEKNLSHNTIEAYIKDVEKLLLFFECEKYELGINEIELIHLESFLKWLNESFKITVRTQSRMVSGIRAFFRYLWIENIIQNNPAELIELPKSGLKLPDKLSIEDIDRIINKIDKDSLQAKRNKAMLETLYSCGLRVGELVNLKLSELYFHDGFVKVIGKGDKERFIPIGKEAIKHVNIYLKEIRCHVQSKKGYEDILFLNRSGRKLTRSMVFTIIKNLSKRSGIKKRVSPHTFRHSFASHLIEGGADLRAVQEMLGHESITTTEIYTHFDKKHLHDTIKRFHPRS